MEIQKEVYKALIEEQEQKISELTGEKHRINFEMQKEYLMIEVGKSLNHTSDVSGRKMKYDKLAREEKNTETKIDNAKEILEKIKEMEKKEDFNL